VEAPAPHPSFLLDTRATVDGVVTIALGGELDLAAAPLLRERIDAAGGSALVLDLSQVTFADSSILRELLRAREERERRGEPLVLAGVPVPLRRLLELTRTADLFEQAADSEAAVARLSG
jgi:anti-sigma B factor antagonist